jgi:hypothetical protein
MSEVQTALSGQKKLSSNRGHGIKKMDLMTQVRQNFGGHQSSGAAPHDGNFDGLRL